MSNTALEFSILGPLEVVERGRPVEVKGKMLRALLLLLLINRRRALTADQLIDDLWGKHAPASARASLHNLVSGLRATAVGNALETVEAGYVLDVLADQLDAIRFERLVVSAAGEPLPERAGTLATALSLWRGSPLVDARYEGFAQSEILRLEELHAWALELRLATELELGRAEEIVPELSALVLRFPFREKLRGLLIAALHRSGRSVEAIESFVEWRQLLRLTWGLEPGRLVAELLDEIRLDAPALAEAMAGATVGGRTRTPRNRPHRRRSRGRYRPRLPGGAGKGLDVTPAEPDRPGRRRTTPASVAQWPSAGFPIRIQRFDSSRRLLPAWARSRRSACAAPGGVVAPSK